MEHNQYSQARSSNGQLGMALGPPPAYGSPPTTANFKPTFQATSGSGGYTVQQTTIADPSSPQLPDIFGGLSFSQFGTDNQLPLTPAKPEKLPDLSGVALGDMYAVPNKDAYGSQPSLSSSPLSVETISYQGLNGLQHAPSPQATHVRTPPVPVDPVMVSREKVAAEVEKKLSADTMELIRDMLRAVQDMSEKVVRLEQKIEVLEREKQERASAQTQQQQQIQQLQQQILSQQQQLQQQLQQQQQQQHPPQQSSNSSGYSSYSDQDKSMSNNKSSSMFDLHGPPPPTSLPQQVHTPPQPQMVQSQQQPMVQSQVLQQPMGAPGQIMYVQQGQGQQGQGQQAYPQVALQPGTLVRTQAPQQIYGYQPQQGVMPSQVNGQQVTYVPYYVQPQQNTRM